MFKNWKRQRLLRRLDKDIQKHGENTEAFVKFNRHHEISFYSIEILHVPIEDEETFEQIDPYILALADIRSIVAGELKV